MTSIEHMFVKGETASYFRGFVNGQHVLFGISYEEPKKGRTSLITYLLLLVADTQEQVDHLLTQGYKMKKKEYFTSNGRDMWSAWNWAVSKLADVEVLAARIADEYKMDDVYVIATSEEKRRERIYKRRLLRYDYELIPFTYRRNFLGRFRPRYSVNHIGKHIHIKENDHE